MQNLGRLGMIGGILGRLGRIWGYFGNKLVRMLNEPCYLHLRDQEFSLVALLDEGKSCESIFLKLYN